MTQFRKGLNSWLLTFTAISIAFNIFFLTEYDFDAALNRPKPSYTVLSSGNSSGEASSVARLAFEKNSMAKKEASKDAIAQNSVIEDDVRAIESGIRKSEDKGENKPELTTCECHLAE
jgi:hypothetical protein